LDIASFFRPEVTEHVASVPNDRVAEQRDVRARLKAEHKLKEKAYRKRIKDNYKPLYTDVYTIREEFFEQSFLDAVKFGTPEALKAITTEVIPGVFVFKMFTDQFRRLLVEELDNFDRSGLPIRRPNSMNNYGVILNDIGFKRAMNELMDNYISPFARLFFPDYGGETLDRNHSFVVKYKIGEDLDLDEHVDDSDVTLNVCLGKSFVGGDLDFHGVKGTPSSKQEHSRWQHKPGIGVLHIGNHWHSALPISEGERWNLIIWCRSSKKRALTPKLRRKHTTNK